MPFKQSKHCYIEGFALFCSRRHAAYFGNLYQYSKMSKDLTFKILWKTLHDLRFPQSVEHERISLCGCGNLLFNACKFHIAIKRGDGIDALQGENYPITGCFTAGIERIFKFSHDQAFDVILYCIELLNILLFHDVSPYRAGKL